MSTSRLLGIHMLSLEEQAAEQPHRLACPDLLAEEHRPGAGMLAVERIHATSMAHERTVFSESPAAISECFDICNSVADWSLALVRKQDSARLSSTSATLVRPGAIDGGSM